MRRILAFSASTIVLCCASVQLSAQSYEMGWAAHKADASRTGVSVANADNVRQTMGCVRGKTYLAPNGRKFKGGATAAVAKLMIAAQDSMKTVKEVVGYCPVGMTRYRPQCELSNWIADRYITAVSEITGRKVDVSIANFGGIRCDMPQGPVTVDDIMSMFPFKNNFCFVAIKGSELRRVYEGMAAHGIQVVGGCQLVIKDRRLVSAKIGGEPLRDDRVYGLATIDFLLTGGDNLFLARNAVELIDTGVTVYDVMLPYVKGITAAGKNIEYHVDDRVIILDEQIY